MKHLTRLTNLQQDEIFHIADEIITGKYSGFLKGKSVILFFSASSIRTRVTIEKGIYLLGGQSILFPNDTLDKKEEVSDDAIQSEYFAAYEFKKNLLAVQQAVMLWCMLK